MNLLEMIKKLIADWNAPIYRKGDPLRKHSDPKLANMFRKTGQKIHIRK